VVVPKKIKEPTNIFMKKIWIILVWSIFQGLFACNNSESQPAATVATTQPSGGQENVKDDLSQKDIVKTAIGSKDHTTLVAAIKQAELVTTLSNAGPFTVFAPTNAAFDKLPPGTLEGLMKEDQKESLKNILEYHVAVGVLQVDNLHDGQVLGMVNGNDATVSIKNGKVMLNNSATILASIPVSNGIIHVIDVVLIPPAKK
jgi:uncharacterized surface protein with fasciclin (FAS1) repeats